MDGDTSRIRPQGERGAAHGSPASGRSGRPAQAAAPALTYENQDRPTTMTGARADIGETGMNNRSILYVVVGVLIVAVAVLAYNLYQAKKQPEGLQINVGPGGVKIQSK